MSAAKPVDPRVRLAIVEWPPDAPRGAVSTFCVEHEISRKTFYEIRKRVIEDGPAAALEPRSRRPHRSPNRVRDETKQLALQVRVALEASGLDHGPISVHDRMRSLGIPAPSVAALARIFRDAGVARLEPRKRPRAAFRRFVYPAPNACWQLDATEYVLAGGRTCVIFQLIDDHSRFAVASHVAGSETSAAAITVVEKAIAAHGVPQRLLSDNGAALNPTRRGHLGQLVAYLNALGVEAITGKPYTPRTQGKNERFHQTLFRWLDKQPFASSLAELQAQVDAFDRVYNDQRPHQALPGRVTPRTAWNATPTVEPPRPNPAAQPGATRRRLGPGDGIRITTISDKGTIFARGIRFQISSTIAGHTVAITQDDTSVKVFDIDGTLIAERPWPAPGVKWVGSGEPRGRKPRDHRTSPMS